MIAAPDIGEMLGAWNAHVRRARMTLRQKLAALIVGSYADNDGTGIRCGVARLAVDMECSHRTARRYLAWLREVGLIELVAEGNRRKGKSDVYRLIIGPHLGEHLKVPDPEEYKAMCKDVADTNQGSSMVSPDRASESTESAPDHGSAYMSPERSITGQTDVDQGSSLCDPPPPINTSPKRTTSQKTAEEDLRTDLALVGAPEPEAPSVVVEIFPGASQEPPFVTAPPGRKLTRGQQTIAEASAKRAAAVAAHRARESS